MDPRFNQAADAFNPYIYGELQLKNGRFTARFAREKKNLSLMLCCVFDDNNPNNLTANGLCKKKNAFYFHKFSPASHNHRRSADSDATSARMSIATRLAAFSNLAMPRMSTEKFRPQTDFFFSLFFFAPSNTFPLSRGRSVVVIEPHTEKLTFCFHSNSKIAIARNV